MCLENTLDQWEKNAVNNDLSLVFEKSKYLY